MEASEKKYLIEKHSPSSPVVKNCFFAFIFGGSICLIGQLLLYLFTFVGFDEKTALTLVTVSLIFAAAILTAAGIFDRIAKYAGAGTLVPVTGFSNSVVSEAIDARSEGFVLGVGSQIFTVAGPVIVYGLLSGAIYGVLYYLYLLF